MATELPTSGGDIDIGTSTRNGAQLAVDQANANHTIPNVTLQLVTKDDVGASGTHDGPTGAANVQALLSDPEEAAKRVLRMLHEGKVQSVDGHDVDVRVETICIHGDTPGAAEFARNLRVALEYEGVRISAPEAGL